MLFFSPRSQQRTCLEGKDEGRAIWLWLLSAVLLLFNPYTVNPSLRRNDNQLPPFGQDKQKQKFCCSIQSRKTCFFIFLFFFLLANILTMIQLRPHKNIIHCASPIQTKAKIRYFFSDKFLLEICPTQCTYILIFGVGTWY